MGDCLATVKKDLFRFAFIFLWSFYIEFVFPLKVFPFYWFDFVWVYVELDNFIVLFYGLLTILSTFPLVLLEIYILLLMLLMLSTSLLLI